MVAGAAAFLILAASALQQAPEITVGIRPTAIRVGDRATLTVQVRSSAGLPELVEFVPPAGLAVEDVRDRSSAGIGTGPQRQWILEREIVLRGDQPGTYALSSVQVAIQGELFTGQGPELSVSSSPLAWPGSAPRPNPGRAAPGASRREVPVLPEGTPPPTGEMGEALPGMATPYGQWWGYPPYTSAYPWGVPGVGGWTGYGPFGGYGSWPPASSNGGWTLPPPGSSPMTPFPGLPGSFDPTPIPGPPGTGLGGGWAETATGDPWWSEIVPELLDYAGSVRSPDGLATLAAGITPQRVFAGQQVTLVATVSLEPGAHLRYGADPEYLPPSPSDFWTVDLPDPLQASPTAAGGQVMQSYTFRRALFPLRAGEFLVPPARLLLPGSGGGAFSPGGGIPGSSSPVAWDTLSTHAMALTVLPVPQVADLPGYAGAVGRYRLEAGITPKKVAVGEAALLVVRILGVGNVALLPPPEIGPVYGAEIAPSGDAAAREVRDGVMGGVRTFTWMVVPVEPGPLRIGPVLFSYFDPYVGGFGQVASEELTLEVSELPGGR